MSRDIHEPLQGRLRIGSGVGARTECGRFGFATFAAAEHAARNTVSDRGDPSRWPHVYKCTRGGRGCGWFHVGHLPDPVADGLVTYDEYFGPVGDGAAMRRHTVGLLKTYGAAPHWSRVSEAWRVAIQIDGRTVTSKPSRSPDAAAEDLIKRIRRIPRKDTA